MQHLLKNQIRLWKHKRGYFESLTFCNLGKVFDLNPRRVPLVKIVGTNGKGSTTRIISQILIESGLKVGSFFSPHLLDWKERIQINLQPISAHKAQVVFQEYAMKLQQFEKKNRELSFFENMLLLAMLVFENEKVDAIVLEAGLGAFRDASYCLEADVAVLTNVGSDHSHILGETRQEIFEEKSAVFDHCQSGVFGDDDELFQALIRKYPQTMISQVRVSDSKLVESSLQGLEFEFQNQGYKTCLLGDHQAHNISIALTAVKQLTHLEVKAAHIESALMKLSHPCRMSLHSYGSKTFLFDGGHNQQGWETLLSFLQKSNSRYCMALCIRTKKCSREQLSAFEGNEPKLGFRTPGPFWNQRQAAQLFPNISYCRSYEKLLSNCLLQDESLIVVTGSLIACARFEQFLKSKISAS